MKRSTPAFIGILFSAVCFSSTYAQPARKPPVLQPSGAQPGQQDPQPAAATQPAEIDPNSVIRVSTSLITVPAIVMDRNGRYVANLRRDDFRIFDNGVEQELTYFASVEKSFTVALMLDVSGSTQSQL